MRIAQPCRPPVWRVVRGRRQLAGAASVAAVGAAGEQHRLAPRCAAEADVAHVDVAEERAADGVVGPDLFLVAEQGAVLLGDDHRRHPRRLAGSPAGGSGGDVVGAGDGDRRVTLERVARRTWWRCWRSRAAAPFAQEKVPFAGRGPNASSGSPLETRPASSTTAGCRSVRSTARTRRRRRRQSGGTRRCAPTSRCTSAGSTSCHRRRRTARRTRRRRA